LRIHEAELMLAEGRESEAIGRYEALLAEAPDAELHRRVFVLARSRGDDERARTHFQAAERLLGRIVDAGEAYTLQELARLYLDAGVNADRAMELATRNLEVKRDRSASETLEAARRASGRFGAASSSRSE
jgi:tetratricopeptide (TPR) repeat protein